MANALQVVNLLSGVENWNYWRQTNHPDKIDLSHADLTNANLRGANLRNVRLSGCTLQRAVLTDADLTRALLLGADMRRVSLQRAQLREANLIGANLAVGRLEESNWEGALLDRAIFVRARMERTRLPGAHLAEANLRKADLSNSDLAGADFFSADLREATLRRVDLRGAKLRLANLTGADLTGADLRGASLEGATLIQANLEGADLRNCTVYGTSTWGVRLAGSMQSDLVITNRAKLVHPFHQEPIITVDNLEVAQFVYLLLNNEKIRNVLDTISTKVVLILGRFTAERKPVLDAIREELRKYNFIPILFDFDKPSQRDLTETVSTLAHIAKFIVADITDAKSIPQELQATIPNLPSVPVQPILQVSEREYAMFEHFKKYPWVLPIHSYRDLPELVATLPDRVIAPAQAKWKELNL